MKLISNLNALGKTIILITHDMRVVAGYCHRVLVINDGCIILDGPPRDTFSKLKVLKDAYLKPPPIWQISSKCGIEPPLLTLNEFCLSGQSR